MRRNPLLFFSSFMMNLNLTMLNLALVYHLADRFALEAGFIGLFVAMGFGSYFAGCNIYNSLESKVSPRFSLPLSSGIIGALSLGIFFSPQIIPALAGLLILQGSLGFYWPPLMGWISVGLEGKELNKNLGYFNQSWSIGALLGPFAAGWLYSLSPVLPFFIGAGGVFLVFIALLIGNKTAPDMVWTPLKNNENSRLSPEDNSTPLRFPSWVGVFGTYAIFGVASTVLPLELRDVLGHGEQAAGNLLLVRGVLSLIGFTILARFTNWHFNRSWIILIQIITIGAIAIMLMLPSNFWIHSAFIILFGLLYSAAYNNSIFHGCSGAINRGGRMAVHEAALTAGVASGSFLGGLFYQKGGMHGVWIFLLILEVLALLAMTALLMVRKKVRT